MPRASERTVTERFADLLQRAESTDAYQIDHLKVEISERIYNAMKEQGVSNAELARRLGKSRAYVTKLLRGTTNFTLESLVKIGRALSREVEFELSSKVPQAKARALSHVHRTTSSLQAVRKTSSKSSATGSLRGSKKRASQS